jgi:hypothetical protein
VYETAPMLAVIGHWVTLNMSGREVEPADYGDSAEGGDDNDRPVHDSN